MFSFVKSFIEKVRFNALYARIKHVAKQHPLAGYPAIMHFELVTKPIFEKQGFAAAYADFQNYLDDPLKKSGGSITFGSKGVLVKSSEPYVCQSDLDKLEEVRKRADEFERKEALRLSDSSEISEESGAESAS